MWITEEEDPIVCAVKEKDPLKVALLIKDGASLFTIDNDGCTLLHLAMRNEDVMVFEMLIAAGADVNESSKGQSLLLKACHKHNMSIINILLDAGAAHDIGATNHAIRHDLVDVLKLILSKHSRIITREEYKKYIDIAKKYDSADSLFLLRAHTKMLDII